MGGGVAKSLETKRLLDQVIFVQDKMTHEHHSSRSISLAPLSSSFRELISDLWGEGTEKRGVAKTSGKT